MSDFRFLMEIQGEVSSGQSGVQGKMAELEVVGIWMTFKTM